MISTYTQTGGLKVRDNLSEISDILNIAGEIPPIHDQIISKIAEAKSEVIANVFTQMHGHAPQLVDGSRIALITQTGMPNFTELLQIDGVIVGKIEMSFDAGGGNVRFTPSLDIQTVDQIKSSLRLFRQTDNV